MTVPAARTGRLPPSNSRWCACGANIGSVRCGWRSAPASLRPPPTAHRILVRHGLPALAATDRATGEPVRRYERARPGELIHIDVKKLGRIPGAGGHRPQGRAEGRRNRTGTGYAYLHTALDDRSRLAYAEDLPDETAATCAAFLQRATAWFAQQGVIVERVLTDSAWAYTKNTGATPVATWASAPTGPGPGGPRPTARRWRRSSGRSDPQTNRPFVPCCRCVDRPGERVRLRRRIGRM